MRLRRGGRAAIRAGLASVTCLLAPCALPPALAAQADSMVVTLLGTGTPNPRIARLGPSTLVEAGGQRLLFDVGRGTTIRLEQLGVRTASVTAVFITHFHSDHTNGLPDLWLTGWLPPLGARARPLRLHGPVGVARLARGLEEAFADDIAIRTEMEHLATEGVAFDVREFAQDTVVFDSAGVRVTAFTVDHATTVRRAVGYRVDYRGRAVVISGDTRYSPALIARARGADLLVHEIAMAPEAMLAIPAIRTILEHHTSPADVARVLTQVRPRLGVLTHYAIPPNRIGPDLTAADALAVVRAGYGGRVEAGEDLMQIVVSDSVRVVLTAAGVGPSATRRAH